MKLFAWLLPKPKREPAPGEKWILKSNDGSPWPVRGMEPITVLAVENGWVRYYLSDIFKDNRMRMSSFLYCYEPYNEDNP